MRWPAARLRRLLLPRTCHGCGWVGCGVVCRIRAFARIPTRYYNAVLRVSMAKTRRVRVNRRYRRRATSYSHGRGSKLPLNIYVTESLGNLSSFTSRSRYHVMAEAEVASTHTGVLAREIFRFATSNGNSVFLSQVRCWSVITGGELARVGYIAPLMRVVALRCGEVGREGAHGGDSILECSSESPRLCLLPARELVAEDGRVRPCRPCRPLLTETPANTHA